MEGCLENPNSVLYEHANSGEQSQIVANSDEWSSIDNALFQHWSNSVYLRTHIYSTNHVQ